MITPETGVGMRRQLLSIGHELIRSEPLVGHPDDWDNGLRLRWRRDVPVTEGRRTVVHRLGMVARFIPHQEAWDGALLFELQMSAAVDDGCTMQMEVAMQPDAAQENTVIDDCIMEGFQAYQQAIEDGGSIEAPIAGGRPLHEQVVAYLALKNWDGLNVGWD